MAIDGETMETVTDSFWWGSKIAADGDRSHEIKHHLLLARKVMANLGSILKSRDISFLANIHLAKTMIFQQSCMGESWSVKKAECQGIYDFEL